MSPDKEILALREKVQKLESNLNERMPAHDRDERLCECKVPNFHKNNSSDHGNTRICYDCMGWGK